MTPSDIASQITQAWQEHIQGNQSPRRKADYIYASRYEPCTRKMVLTMTHGDQLPHYDGDTVARFNRGKDRETMILSQLMMIGRNPNFPFEIVGGQERFELRDHKSRVAIVGKIDAKITIETPVYVSFHPGNCACGLFGHKGQRLSYAERFVSSGGYNETTRKALTHKFSAPLEIKSWSPFIAEKIHSFQDLFHSPWTSKGAYQLLSYLLGTEQPFGFLLLDRLGLPRLIPVELEPNLHLMEEFLTKAETALDHKEKGTLPDYIDDSAECKRCEFYGAMCNPPLFSGNGVVALDPEIESMLNRREELKLSHDEFEDLDETLKDRLRGVEHGVVGNWLIQGRWQKQSKLELPPDVKAKYTVTDLKGKFRLQFVRVK